MRQTTLSLSFLLALVLTLLLSVQSFELFGWGADDSGQLGDGSRVSMQVAVSVNKASFGSDEVVDIAAGRLSSYARTRDGKVYAFGVNSYGQLGANSKNNMELNPVPIEPSLFNNKKIVSVQAAGAQAIALADDGSVFTWGANDQNQLLSPVKGQTNVPYAIPSSAFNGKKIKSVTTGSNHCAVAAEDGTVFTWGTQPYIKNADATVPVEFKLEDFGNKRITSLSSWNTHTLALAEDGTVFCWGSNDRGQCGNGQAPSVQIKTPTPIDSSYWEGKTIIMIRAGNTHSLVLASDGTVFAFGEGSFGILGLGTTGDINVPKKIDQSRFSNLKVIAVAAGATHSAALTEDGQVYVWGLRASGILGKIEKATKGQSMFIATPTVVEPLKGKTFNKIAAGMSYTLALYKEKSACKVGTTGLKCDIDTSFLDKSTIESREIQELPDESVLDVIQQFISSKATELNAARAQVSEAERLLKEVEELCKKKNDRISELENEVALIKMIKEKTSTLKSSDQQSQVIVLLNGLLAELQNAILSTQGIVCDLDTAKKQLVVAKEKLRELEDMIAPYQKVITAFNILRNGADTCAKAKTGLFASIDTCKTSFTTLNEDFVSARECMQQ